MAAVTSCENALYSSSLAYAFAQRRHYARHELTLTFKVIPLKLIYYQTFFETWRNEHS